MNSKDLEETIKSEEVTQLQQEVRQLRTIQDNLPCFIFTIGTELEVKTWNKAAEEVLGYTPEELRSKPILEIIAEDSHLTIMDGIQETFQHGRATRDAEIVTREGTHIPYSFTATPMLDEKGEPQGFMGVGNDISDRKAIESENKMLATVARYSHHLINVAEMDGKMIFLNEAGGAMLGIDPEDVQHTNIMQVIPKQYTDRVEKELLPSLFQGGTWEGDLQYVNLKTGRLTDVHAMTFTVKDQHNHPLYLANISFDITERLKMEDAVRQTEKLEAMAELAGSIGHDFNNFLTGTLGNVSVARSLAAPGSEIEEYLSDAENACRLAAGLTQQLLGLSRGRTPLKETISLSSLLSKVTRFYLIGSQITPVYSIPRDLWTVEADKSQIGQVLQNLVINGKQATRDVGKMNISAENILLENKELTPLPAGKYVKIRIQDFGEGIDKENIPRLFDPSFTTKPGGYGLGLATSYSIVSEHGGKLTVESTRGEGSTFTVYLPASRKNPDTPVAPGVPKKGRILVMDDQEIVQRGLKAMLAKLDYQTTCVADGLEAIHEFQTAKENGTPFDVVILDLYVPRGMGGDEAVHHLRAYDPGVIAIVSSGDSIDKYEELGFDSVCNKPYTMADLQKSIESARGENP